MTRHKHRHRHHQRKWRGIGALGAFFTWFMQIGSLVVAACLIIHNLYSLSNTYVFNPSLHSPFNEMAFYFVGEYLLRVLIIAAICAGVLYGLYLIRLWLRDRYYR